MIRIRSDWLMSAAESSTGTRVAMSAPLPLSGCAVSQRRAQKRGDIGDLDRQFGVARRLGQFDLLFQQYGLFGDAGVLFGQQQRLRLDQQVLPEQQRRARQRRHRRDQPGQRGQYPAPGASARHSAPAPVAPVRRPP